MTDANAESDYTPYTILTILVVTALIVFFAYSIDLISHLDDSASSFQSSSSLVPIDGKSNKAELCRMKSV